MNKYLKIIKGALLELVGAFLIIAFVYVFAIGLGQLVANLR